MKPFKARIAKVAEILNEFSKNDLQASFLTKAKKVATQFVDVYVKDGADKTELNLAFEAKNPTKEKILLVCALAFYNQNTYQAFLKMFTPRVQELWTALIWSAKLYHSEIESKLGFNAFKRVKESYYVHFNLLSEFSIFKEIKSSYYYSDREPALFLPTAVRSFLHQYHEQPPQAILRPIETELKTQLEFVNGEQLIFQELPRILAYYKQAQITYTNKYRPANNGMSKFQRTCSITEFLIKPNEDKRKGKSYLRSALLAAMLPKMRELELQLELPAFLQQMFKHYTDRVYTAPMVLPDLKGMGYLDDFDFNRIEPAFFKLFKSLPSGAWLSFDNIQQHTFYNLLEFKAVKEYPMEQKLYYEYDNKDVQSRDYGSKHPLKSHQYYNAIELPFLRGSFFLFAAFGLCDLKFDEPDLEQIGRTCFSSWDGLRYVRRTALGDYVCGRTAQYDAFAMLPKQEIMLSEETLLITTEGNSTALGNLFESYAERVGPNSLRTDSRIFLKNISSIKDLQNKIGLFKQLIGQQLPNNWLAFFETLEQKINPFENPGDYQLYKIPAQNKELIQLVAQDSILKSMLVKAEGYIILVPKSHLLAFKKRLLEFGYFVS
jgi:hypothetical protein